MTEVTSRQTWQLTLQPPELLLVLKALCGRLREHEIEAARELGDRLTTLKAKHLDAALRENQKLLKNLDSSQ